MLYKAKLLKGGKISIPAGCRKQFDLREGEEVIFTPSEYGIVISPLKTELEQVRKLVNKYTAKGESLVDMLIAERREEAENE